MGRHLGEVMSETFTIHSTRALNRKLGQAPINLVPTRARARVHRRDAPRRGARTYRRYAMPGYANINPRPVRGASSSLRGVRHAGFSVRLEEEEVSSEARLADSDFPRLRDPSFPIGITLQGSVSMREKTRIFASNIRDSRVTQIRPAATNLTDDPI